MAHQRRNVRTKPRNGSGFVSVLFAVSGFAIVLGAFYYVSQQNAADPTGEPVAVEANAAEIPQEPSTLDNSRDAEVWRISEVVPSTNEAGMTVAHATANGLHSTPVEKTPAEVQELVDDYIAVGEFNAAIEASQTLADAYQQTELLKQVVHAQIKAGEFAAAQAAVQQVATPEERAPNQAAQETNQDLAGGSQADFQPLIDLIQQETSGPWFEIDGAGGTMTQNDTGVRVDPNGLLTHITREERTGQLQSLGLRARTADLNNDMAQSSDLRLVSLTRLEREVAKRLEQGESVVETMQRLAGISQVQYVFVYPEQGEVIIGGPAESWNYAADGTPVGAESGRPMLHLDDLVTVLRTFSVDGLGVFGCSINPRQEGLASLKQYVERTNQHGALSPGAQVRHWVNQLQRRMGLQDIVVYGVPEDSRVARVLVEADYRMKLIGIGKLDGGSDIPSIFDLLTEEEQKSSKLDALRWWLSMKYDAVGHSPNRDVFQIQGASVLCQSENQFVTAAGDRIQTGQSDATNSRFAGNFTDGYSQLSEREPVFADLQNVFDLALVAALMRSERVAEQIGWDMGVFAADGPYEPASYAVPTAVQSVVNHRVYRGHDIVVQVAGGVSADVTQLVDDSSKMRAVDRLNTLLSRGLAPELPEGRWWWDATR